MPHSPRRARRSAPDQAEREEHEHGDGNDAEDSDPESRLEDPLNCRATRQGERRSGNRSERRRGAGIHDTVLLAQRVFARSAPLELALSSVSLPAESPVGGQQSCLGVAMVRGGGRCPGERRVATGGPARSLHGAAPPTLSEERAFELADAQRGLASARAVLEASTSVLLMDLILVIQLQSFPAPIPVLARSRSRSSV